ncbi:MAG: 16S rRNA (adenine(1518)-N(6)/adenine(1519)-N(6))-dimethyltransferase RsmA [bacterium]|nr:16S rRNA (adenine(1518)-N(6)/adenine(1519)-N(6))-dimethyltransferase RsmA [bacterium]
MNLRQTKELLARHQLAPHKRLGQNFLVHSHTAQRIVDLAGLNPEDTVVEVGVGLGALTRPLAGAAARVIGVEADSGIIRLHEELQDLPQNVRLVHADILKLNLAELCPNGARLKIVANLPYSISSPFLFHLIEHREHLDSAVIMLQKELGLRLNAQPGSKVYGAPTVLLAACADVEPLLAVGPAEFHPQPQVDSLVLRLSFYPEPARIKPLGAFNRSLFSRIVRAAFAQRRKTLLNALRPLEADKEKLAMLLESADIAPTARAETLAPADFIRLSQVMAANPLLDP